MSKHVSIVFEHEITDEQVKDYVKQSTGESTTVLVDGKTKIIVKEVKEEKQTTEKVRMVAGTIARSLRKQKVSEAHVNDESAAKAFATLNKNDVVTAFVEGWDLGSYEFLNYKTKKELFKTDLIFANADGVKEQVDLGKARAEATAFSRDLVNEIPSVLHPESFPIVLQDAFANTDVNVTVYDKQKIEEENMQGMLHVGRGSVHDPRFVEMTYQGDPSKPLVALVGKGVTFDTGGISLKLSRDLSSMRMDMGGAAAVAGAMKLLADTKAQVNVVALLQIVENMPDRRSLIPGDVIRYKNGHTVQVGNTDAEGRLVLADGLIRAGELNAEYIINIATLTGAVANALGSDTAGVFGDEELSNELRTLGNENGDRVWPLPLIDAYDSYLDSDYADFSNISSKGEAGSITAALFLRRFVPENSKWLHVDMAGRMASTEKGYYGNSATGFGARLLSDYTEHVSK